MDGAAETLERGRLVLIYAVGGLPYLTDAAEAAPGTFRSGFQERGEGLAESVGAQRRAGVIPGQAGEDGAVKAGAAVGGEEFGQPIESAGSGCWAALSLRRSSVRCPAFRR